MTDVPTGHPDEARRSRLLGVKLRALVRDHVADDTVAEAVEFAPGAALMHGDQAWILVADRPHSRLGASLAWSLRNGANSTNVVAETGTGVLARRAAEFTMPISIWHVDGRILLPAVAEPFAPERNVVPEHAAFRSEIAASGAEPVEEFGVVSGEVHGLEVCRVVDDPDTGAARLEVGVGTHDREAFRMLHGDTPTAESLARVVETVAAERRVGVSPHPLNRLAAERLIRWQLLQSPELVGARSLVAAPPPVPRANLKDDVPCVAVGDDPDGRSVVVVCASGVDLDLIPYAADARLAALSAATSGVGVGGDLELPRLVVATPSRDRIRLTGELAGLLRQSVEFVSVD